MLVLVSFVLVLAAAVTLVVGLLQSGLTLIYLSIACSVLAGVVLAVAVLRGRPEPRAAAPVGRAFTPPAAAPPQQVPASVGAPATSTYESAPAWTPPPSPPPPPPTSAPPGPTDDAATKAAGTALLGRLRRRPEEPAPAAAPEPEPQYDAEPATAQYAAVSDEADDGFPIADYDRMRATDLLRRLGSLDRNQLEAVRAREEAGKNRFTIMSRIDVLLAGMTEPAWDAADDDWEDDEAAGVEAVESDTTVIEVGAADDFDDEDDFAPAAVDDFALDDDDWGDEEPADVVTPIPLGGGEMEDDEVDELVSPAEAFPIAGYESLTVGQILPRLSDLDADQLAQVRGREQEGRARATILDRIDRLASKSGAAPSAPARARKAPARKTPAVAATTTPAPRKARVAKVAPAAVEPAPAKAPARRGGARKAAATEAASAEVVKKAGARKAAVKKAPAAEPVAKKAPARRKAAAPAAETPMKAAVKKARAAKKQR